MTQENVNIMVNGNQYNIKGNEREMTLLNWLRDVLKMTGAKCGCAIGHCGACVVLINDKVKKACLVKIGKLVGSEIITIEGLAANGKLHPVQESFIECGAIQCGYCTPSMIIASVGLLNENLNPTREEIDKALKQVYCRCGTYPRVIKAIERAAAIMRGEKYERQEGQEEIKISKEIIGKSVLMHDLVDKVTGRLKYVDDYSFDHMLYGKIIWSEYPYARIKGIDTREASNMKGVNLVFTHENIPEFHYGPIKRDQIILAKDCVRYIGEPVAAVFADTVDEAECAAKKIKVNYEELEPILSPRRALEPDAPRLHEMDYKKATYQEGPVSKDAPSFEMVNIIREVKINKGNIDDTFKQAEVVVEGEYYVPRIEHAWIETESAVAMRNEKGGVDVYAQTQSPFRINNFLASLLEIEENKVNVIQVPLGGSFGGKGEFMIPALASLAAVRTGKPVKITLTRKESLRFHPKRHPYFMNYRIAAKKDGELLGMDIDLFSDGGAYASFSPGVMPQSCTESTGPYCIPNLRVNGKVVFTNNLNSGAMRGYGAPQVHFAVETQMDILARKLGIDPIDLRMKNAVKEGSEISTGQILGKGNAFDKTLTIIKEEVNKKLLPLKKDDRNVGIGIASGWRHIGGGMGPDEDAGASILLQPNGRMLLKISTAEMGQETQIGLAQICAHTLDIPYSKIDISPIETAKVPYGGAVMSSRGLFLWGKAVETTSQTMKKLLLNETSQLTGVPEDNILLSNGIFSNKQNNKTLLNLEELANYINSKKTLLEITRGIRLPKTYYVLEDGNRSRIIPENEYIVHHTHSYITTAVAVKMDKESKDVKVLKVIAAVDAGTIINVEAAKKQIEGGIIMGMGAALQEEFLVENGRNITDTFKKCKIPDITMTPEIDVIFVENYDPTGPLGAKGVGEMGILSVTPAITNAIFDATGERLYKLPAIRYLAGHYSDSPTMEPQRNVVVCKP